MKQSVLVREVVGWLVGRYEETVSCLLPSPLCTRHSYDVLHGCWGNPGLLLQLVCVDSQLDPRVGGVGPQGAAGVKHKGLGEAKKLAGT